MQGWFNIHNPTNVIQQIHKMKDKNYTIISIDVEKNIWQDSTPIYDRNSHSSGYRSNLLQHNIGHNDKPTGNVILNGEKLKANPIKSGIRQGCTLSPLFFNIVLEVLDKTIRQDNEIKAIHIWQKEVKLSLFLVDLILYIENPKNSNKKTIRNYKQIQ